MTLEVTNTIPRKLVHPECEHLLTDIAAKKPEYLPGPIGFSVKAPISGKFNTIVHLFGSQTTVLSMQRFNVRLVSLMRPDVRLSVVRSIIGGS
jgi:hypothetical protein